MTQAAAWIIPLLFLYVLVTGLKAASLRSALMAAVALLGLIANRQPLLFNNLCAAGFLILLADTNELFNPGFQLSFSASLPPSCSWQHPWLLCWQRLFGRIPSSLNDSSLLRDVWQPAGCSGFPC